MTKATNIAIKKQRGRPMKGKTPLGTQIGMRFDDDLLAEIDAFAGDRKRTDAVRELVQIGLAAVKKGGRK